MHGEAGKGCRYRPVDGAKYRENYDRIFGEKKCKNQTCRTAANDDSLKQERSGTEAGSSPDPI